MLKRITLTLLTPILLTQCQRTGKQEPSPATPTLTHFTYQQPLMGTHFKISLYAKNQTQADTAARAALQFATDVNSACSDYNLNSELMRLNASPHNQPIHLSPLLHNILHTALAIAENTHGAYDPTLGHHSYNWRMARKKNTLPTSGAIIRAQTASGWKKIQLNRSTHTAIKLTPNMRLDLGGIAKGYAADGMLRTLNKHHITRAAITAGGEILLGNPPPNKPGWPVTIKTLDGDKTLTLTNCAISTSGDLHQSISIHGTRYSHIVNPATGLGLTTRVSATVIGPTCTLTDALATALCVKPSLSPPNTRFLVITLQPNGTTKTTTSNNWPQ